MHELSVCGRKVKVNGSVHDSPQLKRELRASKQGARKRGRERPHATPRTLRILGFNRRFESTSDLIGRGRIAMVVGTERDGNGGKAQGADRCGTVAKRGHDFSFSHDFSVSATSSVAGCVWR